MNTTKPHELMINNMVEYLNGAGFKFTPGSEDVALERIRLPVKFKKNYLTVMADMLKNFGLQSRYLQLNEENHTWLISQSPKSHNVWHIVLNTSTNILSFQWAYMNYGKQ